MPRLARAVVPGVAHHLTQRGVDQRDVFLCDTNRQVYPRLAALSLETFQVRVLAYCLMSNHVHWVVVPPSTQALSRAFGFLHGRYAQHMNTALCRSATSSRTVSSPVRLRRSAYLGGSSLRGTQSCASRPRGGCRALGMVERRREARPGRNAFQSGLSAMERALHARRLAGVAFERLAERSRKSLASEHLHWLARRGRGFCSASGTEPETNSPSSQRRTTTQKC
jgi:REP element-mobilizing transposase RayT